MNPNEVEIKNILKESKTIAVVGLSPKLERPSNGVASYLKSQGYKIIPVNPGHKEILGEKCYSALTEIPEKVDVVDIFRQSDAVPDIVQDAIKIGAKVIWMQEGIIHNEAAERAKNAGLKVVMNKCILKEHINFIGE